MYHQCSQKIVLMYCWCCNSSIRGEMKHCLWFAGLLVLFMRGTAAEFSCSSNKVPIVVILTEGESITYEYGCEESERATLCYYYIEDGTISLPMMVQDEGDLPDGMSLVQQECPLYNATSAKINASLNMTGLVLFYSLDSGCVREESTGPRPLRLIVTEAAEADEVAHMPILVALTEGETITYEYDCEEMKSAALCFYIEDGSMSYPKMLSEQHDLPDGMSPVQQECPLYDVDSAKIDASLSIWGLLLFYSPDGGCGIDNSTGPRPLRLIVTEAVDSDKLAHTPLLTYLEPGQMLNFTCPSCGYLCLYEYDEEPTLPHRAQCSGPDCSIEQSTLFFCAKKLKVCALHLSVGPRPVLVVLQKRTECSTVGSSSVPTPTPTTTVNPSVNSSSGISPTMTSTLPTLVPTCMPPSPTLSSSGSGTDTSTIAEPSPSPSGTPTYTTGGTTGSNSQECIPIVAGVGAGGFIGFFVLLLVGNLILCWCCRSKKAGANVNGGDTMENLAAR